MHIYTLDGIDYPSVTTVLSLISTDEALMKWANIMGFKHKDIEKIKNDSASFGTLIHAHLRGIVDDSFIDVPEFKDSLEKYKVEKVKFNFNNYFKNISYNTIYTEKTIISKELGYAGTLDWMAIINELKFLNDFKTSKTIHDTMFLQLGGYYNLLHTIGEDIDCGSIITINEKRCQMHPILKADLEYYGKLFNMLYEFYREYKMRMKIEPKYEIIQQIKQTDNKIVA